MSIAPRKYTEFSTKQRKICCVQTRRVLTNNLNYTLTSNTATVPCPASSSGLILWHRFYNDDSPFGPSFLLIKIQATMDNDFNNFNSIPRSTETDLLFTFGDAKTKNQNQAQEVSQCFFSAKCGEQQLSRRFLLGCKIRLIANVFAFVRGCFCFACNCDLSSQLLICWSLSWNFHKCSSPPKQLKTKEKLFLDLNPILKTVQVEYIFFKFQTDFDPGLFHILWH